MSISPLSASLMKKKEQEKEKEKDKEKEKRTRADGGDDYKQQGRAQGPDDPRAEEADDVPPVPARGAVRLPLFEVEVGAAVPVVQSFLSFEF